MSFGSSGLNPASTSGEVWRSGEVEGSELLGSEKPENEAFVRATARQAITGRFALPFHLRF